MIDEFIRAVMVEMEKTLRWTSQGVYRGQWREDLARARERICQAEKACGALEALRHVSPTPESEAV